MPVQEKFSPIDVVQDIVHYLRTNLACSKAVRGAILQVPFLFVPIFYLVSCRVCFKLKELFKIIVTF